MPTERTWTVEALEPDSYGIQLQVKVVELLVRMEADDGQGNTTSVYEYLVGDQTSSVVLQTTKELPLHQVLRIQNAYTQVVEGSLRLVVSAENITIDASSPPSAIESIGDHNISLIQFKRRA
ncbi:uncharacterized protein BYT42DRAFT_614565 [Radiomyces spectabilis]|uniref:uncharacterized protein n=1 Tax=Radiomyces spectabilis TaxID=64574 RepID=UPI00221EA9B0|nr:uncharacterized protein BYT42DRAFT_614565 [Radiomyces spectabilis]KAI8377918.1 hypothetical protein BYT42DRAFT_614565 [Radiomyces spectabilis]